MKPAHYSVIRYIADPGRNEALNVGILLWAEGGHRLRIDDAAVARVIRENPRLNRNALDGLRATLERELLPTPFTEEGLLRLLESHPGFPVSLTEARYTTVAENLGAGLDDTLERLIERIVRPKRRG